MLFSTTGKPGNGERGESQPWGTGAGRLNCRAEGGGGGWIQGQSQRGYCPLGLGSSPQPTRPIPVDPSPSVWQFGPWAPLRVLCVWAGALAGLSLPEPVWFRWLQGHRRRLPQTLASRPPPQGALASTSEQPHFSLGRRWAGPVGGEEVGGRSHRDAGWRLQPSPGGGGRRAPPGTALSFPAGNKRLCVSSLRRAGLQIEIIKSLWFSNQCEVINVLAWSVINPGAAAQAQDNGGFFFGSVVFFFFFTGR